MMLTKYTTANNHQKFIDLDSVIDVVKGESGIKTGWTALIIYDPTSKKFVELRDSPQDYQGNAMDEAEEVDEAYLINTFKIPRSALADLYSAPTEWKTIIQ